MSTPDVDNNGTRVLPKLQPLAQEILAFLMRHPHGVSAQDAMLHLDGLSSGSLTRRITDLENAGFAIVKEVRANPYTKRRYTRYRLETQEEAQAALPGMA